MYTACHNYGKNYGDVDKGHRANGFTTDGGFCEYQVNSVNTLIAVDDSMSDEEATLVVTAGTSMYGLTELGGLVAGDSVVVSGPGPIGLLGAAVAKALGAHPVILTGTRDNRLEIGKQLGADHVINVRNEDAVEAVRRLTGGKGVDFVLECSGAPNAVNEAAQMLNRGGKICLAAFPSDEAPIDVAYLVRNNIYLYGIRGEGKSATHRAEAFMRQKRFDATIIHTHTFDLEDLPEAIRYARDRVEDAIKVVVTNKKPAADRHRGGASPRRPPEPCRVVTRNPSEERERCLAVLGGSGKTDREILGYSRYRVAVAAFAVVLVISPFEYAWSSISGHIGDTYGWSDHQIDLMFTLFVVFQSVGMLPGGLLRDKFGPRWTTAIAGLFSGLGIFSVTLGPSYGLVLTGWCIGSFFTGFLYNNGVTTGNKWFR